MAAIDDKIIQQIKKRGAKLLEGLDLGDMMSDPHRATAREIARRHLETGDPLGWFEDLYSRAGEETSIIPWASMRFPSWILWTAKNLRDAGSE